MAAAAAMGFLQNIVLAKVRPPKPTSLTIERDALVEMLAKCLSHRIVTVEGPGGTAKTGFLAEAQRRLGKDASRWRTAWLSADELDVPERLWRHVLVAWHDEFPELDVDELMGLYRENPLLYTVAVSNYLADYALDPDLEYVLFVDDLSDANPVGVREFLNAVAEYFPINFHVVASGRIGLWENLDLRFRDDVDTIPESTLAFSEDEIEQVLARALEGIGCPEGVTGQLAANLEEVTGGWALAVRTYADAIMRGTIELVTEVDEQGLGHLLNRFYREKVLDALPGGYGEFIIDVSLVDCMTPELCNFLTGRDDSKAVLRDLRKRGCFIEPCRDEQGWLAFHPLFHRWLRRKQGQLGDARLRELCRRAAQWFAGAGFSCEAAKYMLMASEASFVESLASAVGYESERDGTPYFDWIASIPAAQLAADPRLALQVTWGYICGGRVQDALEWGKVFSGLACEAEGGSGQEPSVAVELVNVKCLEMECRYEEAIERASGYLAGHEEDLSLQQRCLYTHALAECYLRVGRLDQALKSYLQAEVMAELGESPFFVALSRMGIIWMRIAQGELSGALELADKALKECPKAIVTHGALLSAKGYIYVELGRLDEARPCVESAREALSSTRNVDMLYEAEAVHAHYLAAAGMQALAFHAITKVSLVIDGRRIPRSVDLLVYRLQALATLSMGYLDEARAAVGKLRAAIGAKDVVNQLGADALDALVDNNYERRGTARDLLESIDLAAEKGLRLYEMELCICAADRLAREGAHADALVYMNRALRLQAGQRIVAPFLRAGGQTRTLLHEIVDVRKSGGQLRQSAKAILRQFSAGEPEDESAEKAAGPALHFNLTEREIEVLDLLNAGLSRREIAETLTVSLNTVKSHIGNIYVKLGVTNRIDAFSVFHGE